MDLQLVSEDLEKAVSTAVGQDKHGTDILNESDVRAPISPLHLAAVTFHEECSTVPASWFGKVRGGAMSTWWRRPDTSGYWGGSYTPPSQCGPSPSSQTTRATRHYTWPATTVCTGQRDSEVGQRPQTNTHINIACLKSPQPASGGHEPRQSAQEP
ncbi:uncharacterized protein LOC116370677 isoform X1 [Oncorhynchus kisutch]|uniref:uncharacterized protein LOC116359266 isoform X1 n=1 Tax=Oncorhynchus kisutch TaxID=8019 RepID=UPI0012DE9849|nr:uncharacterized protein LOC116359266 isoform X1 [Oncorhynchus kisutch]XP_031673517.1 uncharacterized protein LOC116364628 isoform X1 [Oncorhynchus kisutch]XP_031674084.1 uncharacterized protein LOC116365838 isoform X1 [Oncorhynchus kisutch]XP_031675706.1 uncharacterized protein LOC116370649 isoform X1 [Oncorhynchus kisutch]XP_031675715.1 uncharacterized protein LOC116370676 isoform X1 [Oncorhynchus kisutch]XP_031675720.1 uncharacterized protein LOC116370677 isoform X1 [Oncorhynchus kisutch]